ncbi:MAG TPA: YaeQ family protein [Rhodanobacteraceae bacterium]|nr:YaeQ family protein [Rhodanobacteraceae bacterium]
MALSATIHKVELTISDMDRHYYATHALTLARHPSETEARLMVRLLAFALYANDRLEFGRGLSDVDEPALWHKAYTGEIQLWIDVGLPDEARLRKACAQAQRVVVLAYGGHAEESWWHKNAKPLARLENLTVLQLAPDDLDALTGLCSRGMRLQALIQDGEVSLIDTAQTLSLRILTRQGHDAPAGDSAGQLA